MRPSLIRQKSFAPIALALLSTLLFSCVHRGSVNTKTEIQDLQNRLYELQKRNAEAQVQIQELKEGGNPAQNPPSPGPAHSGLEPAEASQEEPIVPGSTVDLGEAGPSRSGEVVAGSNAPSAAPGQEPPKSMPASSNTETDKLYIDGYAQLNSGNYQRAEQEFGEFLARSPESDLADDAQYWMGECYFSQKDYHRAILEFRKVIDQYPFGNRVPHAFLKVGLSYLALGDRERAAENLETVVQAFPKSEVATVAKATLDEINKTSPR